MCREEIDLCIKLYGMNAWNESLLPSYQRRLTGKHVSESIPEQIITSQVRNIEYYDDHRFPLPSTLLKTIKKRKYISEEPGLTYRISQKGLMLLGVALLDEGEILSINKLHDYITSASLTSCEDIKICRSSHQSSQTPQKVSWSSSSCLQACFMRFSLHLAPSSLN